jgi:hypothetical protein
LRSTWSRMPSSPPASARSRSIRSNLLASRQGSIGAAIVTGMSASFLRLRAPRSSASPWSSRRRADNLLFSARPQIALNCTAALGEGRERPRVPRPQKRSTSFTFCRSVPVSFRVIRVPLVKRIPLITLHICVGLRNVSIQQHCCIKASVGLFSL